MDILLEGGEGGDMEILLLSVELHVLVGVVVAAKEARQNQILVQPTQPKVLQQTRVVVGGVVVTLVQAETAAQAWSLSDTRMFASAPLGHIWQSHANLAQQAHSPLQGPPPARPAQQAPTRPPPAPPPAPPARPTPAPPRGPPCAARITSICLRGPACAGRVRIIPGPLAD